MKVTVISSDGNVIDHPMPEGGQDNEYCKIPETKPMDHSENSHSLGVLINFGRLKILDLGDLTWDKEMQFMCPKNLLGNVDDSCGFAPWLSPKLQPCFGRRYSFQGGDYEQCADQRGECAGP